MTSFTPGDPGEEFAPAYATNLGLNEALRINGSTYIYDPDFGVWLRGLQSSPTMPEHLDAEAIHHLMSEGVRVLPWTELPS